ncbi:MAG: ABC transporter substrate-binding protein [Spirochaetia bacterium]|jgi:raffinose/stachyose/melibiose transport system substrate-binding protein
MITGRTRGRSLWFLVTLAAVLLMVSGGALFATGTSESSGGTTSQPINLTIAGSQDFNRGDSWVVYQPNPNFDAFEAKNPGVKIQLLLNPDPQNTQILQTQLATGEPSDIMFYNKVSAENELGAEQNMVDLSSQPWVARLQNKSPLTAPDGKIYGFNPVLSTEGLGMVYNIDIFNKLNLQVPTTFQQLLAVCDTLKANGITPIYGPFKDVWTFQIWTTSAWGVYVTRKDPTLFDRINKNQVKWADVPGFLDALSRGNTLVQKGYFQPTALSDDYNSAPAAMSSGRYAMMIIAKAFVSDMLSKDPSVHLGLFAFPVWDDPAMNVIVQPQLGPLLFVPKKAKHVAAAEKLIDFLSQAPQIAAVNAVASRSFMPNLKDVPAVKLQPTDQQVYDTYIKTGKVSVEANAFVKVDLTDLWKYYQDMIGGAKTPQQVLTAWDAKFDELMKAKGFPGF